MATKKTKAPLVVDTLKHDGATRKNIPTAEYQSVMAKDEQSPRPVAYARAGSEGLQEEKTARNRDLDPQLIWRGKDEQDWSNLVVQAPPLYIQEKVHPKVLIDELRRESERQREAKERGNGQITDQVDLFADFNGLPNDNARTEFYQHDSHWANRMILGDSLQVMASLAEREGLRGKMPFFVKPVARMIAGKAKAGFVSPNLRTHLDFMEGELVKSEWFAGPDFTGADIQMSFPVEAAKARGGLDASRPRLMAWLERIHARPAYGRALERGGPYGLLS